MLSTTACSGGQIWINSDLLLWLNLHTAPALTLAGPGNVTSGAVGHLASVGVKCPAWILLEWFLSWRPVIIRQSIGGFLKNGGYPSYHPCYFGIFHDNLINHPAVGVSPWKPPIGITSSDLAPKWDRNVAPPLPWSESAGRFWRTNTWLGCDWYAWPRSDFKFNDLMNQLVNITHIYIYIITCNSHEWVDYWRKNIYEAVPLKRFASYNSRLPCVPPHSIEDATGHGWVWYGQTQAWIS